jgi:uncharacterized protein (TIGR04255 family)
MNYIRIAKNISSVESPPIVDAICEVRFNSIADANLIPGLLHVELDKQNLHVKISDIESAHLIPTSLRETDPVFKNLLLHELDYNSARVRFGPSSLLISACDPYPGWQIFSSDISTVLLIFIKAKIINDIERVGIRFINFLELASIRSSLNIGTTNEFRTEAGPEYEIPLLEEAASLALTYKSGENYARITIQEPVRYIDSTSEEKEGIIIDIDAFQGESSLDAENLEEVVEKLHDLAKSIFFASVKPDALGKIHLKQ